MSKIDKVGHAGYGRAHPLLESGSRLRNRASVCRLGRGGIDSFGEISLFGSGASFSATRIAFVAGAGISKMVDFLFADKEWGAAVPCHSLGKGFGRAAWKGAVISRKDKLLKQLISVWSHNHLAEAKAFGVKSEVLMRLRRICSRIPAIKPLSRFTGNHISHRTCIGTMNVAGLRHSRG